ncbi:MAG: hypothetical protein OJF52_001165 [Nitrospira sp.]|nr:MAG: hypothetical protein OJF52_001165 [Nitrospira sp.]
MGRGNQTPHRHVSILARPEGRALLWSAITGTIQTWGFQSSPVPKDGRYTDPRSTARVTFVSILARPEGRALQSNRRFTESCGCFNPRPSRRTGATPCGGFLKWLICCFNPRPSRRTGATALGKPRGFPCGSPVAGANRLARHRDIGERVSPPRTNSFQLSILRNARSPALFISALGSRSQDQRLVKVH